MFAWNVFLKDGADGRQGASVIENYQNPGLAFALVALVFVLTVTLATRKYAVDSRDDSEITGNSVGRMYRDIFQVLLDPVPRSLTVMASGSGILFAMLSLVAIFIYPITREVLFKLREEREASPES